MNVFLLIFFFLFIPILYLPAATDIISFSGNPATLTINSATAGSQPNSVSNASTTYSVGTTTIRKITGVLASAMPSGVTLKVRLTAPSGATSLGLVTLSTTAANLVININSWPQANNLAVTYTISATVSSAKVTNATNTVTFTLI